MKNLIQSTTDLAMSIARQYIRPGCLIIDATCGNGQDTLSLAKAAQTADCKLLAIDIQEEAIDHTRALLINSGFAPALDDGTIRLLQASHENLQDLVQPQDPTDPVMLQDMINPIMSQDVCLIMFNLGYLPGGDKRITTQAASTMTAVRNALEIIMPDGLVCITVYSGHEAGKKEKQALLEFAEELDSHKYHVSYISMPNQKNHPPEILLITRKS